MIDQNIDKKGEPYKKVEEYQAFLEIDQQERKIKKNQEYSKAYIISFLFPPLGVYYFFKYLFFATGSSKDIKAGIISLALTGAVILVNIWAVSYLSQQLPPSSSSPSLDLIRKSIAPSNMKELIKLYQ